MTHAGSGPEIVALGEMPELGVVPQNMHAFLVRQDRFGEPKDVAAAALFLAGDSGAYVTGQTMHINGGMAMI